MSMRMLQILAVATLFWTGHALSFDDIEASKKPLSKVVELLKDMSKQLEADQTQDTQLKESMDCWCKTSKAEKEEAIARNKEKVEQLSTLITETNARLVMLDVEIKSHTKELSSIKQTLEQASAIRQQQVLHYEKEKKSLMDSLSGVASAAKALGVQSLSNASTKLIQLADVLPADAQVISRNLKHVIETQSTRLMNLLSRADRLDLQSFANDPHALIGGGKAFLQNGQVPSKDAIAGILTSMADSMAADLQNLEKSFVENEKSYVELKDAKETEGATLQNALTSKTKEHRDDGVTVARSQQDLVATQKVLEEGEKFQQLVKEKCQSGDTNYEARLQARTEEMTAISEAISLLSSDEARDLHSEAVSFLQKAETEQESAVAAKRIAAAADFLAAAGKRLKFAALVTLALQFKSDSFTKVKEAIEHMITGLKKEQADEIAQKDMCEADLRKNELATEDKTRVKGSHEDNIQELANRMLKLNDTVKEISNDMSEMRKQLQIAGETRQKENVAFQADIDEQKATQALLKKAIAVLSKTFGTASLMQIKAHSKREEPALGAPEGFKEYKKSSGGASVIALLEQILQDSVKGEADAAKEEQESQSRYESFIQQTNEGIEAETSELNSVAKQKADAESELTESRQSLSSTSEELKQLAITIQNLHSECDFTLKNFDVRQKARTDEIEALKEATAILNGADFGSSPKF